MSKCWPAEADCPGFKEEAKAFMKEVQGVSRVVLELLAEGVGLVSSAYPFPPGFPSSTPTDLSPALPPPSIAHQHFYRRLHVPRRLGQGGFNVDFEAAQVPFLRGTRFGGELLPCWVNFHPSLFISPFSSLSLSSSGQESTRLSTERRTDLNAFRREPPNSAHADFDILTLLFQKVGQDGLEVCPGRSISTDFGYGELALSLSLRRR